MKLETRIELVSMHHRMQYPCRPEQVVKCLINQVSDVL